MRVLTSSEIRALKSLSLKGFSWPLSEIQIAGVQREEPGAPSSRCDILMATGEV